MFYVLLRRVVRFSPVTRSFLHSFYMTQRIPVGFMQDSSRTCVDGVMVMVMFMVEGTCVVSFCKVRALATLMM